MKYSLRKGVAVTLATLGLASCFTACGNNKQSKSEPSTEVTQEITQTPEEKSIPLRREDGSDLMLLLTSDLEAKHITCQPGYITYDKNGVYFDNALTNIRVILSDEAIFPSDLTEFYYLNVSYFSKNNLINESKLNDLVSKFNKIDGSIIDNYDYSYHSCNSDDAFITVFKLFNPSSKIKLMQETNNNEVYSLDREEAIKLTETTTYTDGGNVTIENSAEITSAKTLR